MQVRRAESADLDVVRSLCWDYRDLLAREATPWPGIMEYFYPQAAYQTMLADLDVVHAPPKGAIYVAEVNEQIVGTGMTYEINPGMTELKRLYVGPEARGKGAAKAILSQAIEDARAAGQYRFVLDTIASLTGAIALYDRFGFERIAAYYDPDPRYADALLYFGLDLQARGT